MRETINKLKQANNFKEIGNILPESFYNKGSLVLIILMILMVDFETINRYLTRHQTLEYMVKYYYVIGYLTIAFVLFSILAKGSAMGMPGIKNYFKGHVYEIFFVLLILWSGLCMILSNARNDSFLGHWFRNSGFRSYLIFGSFYICGKFLRRDRINRFIIYATFMITNTVQNILLITNHFGLYGSRTGAFYNRNHSAYFMVIGILSSAGIVILSKKVISKIVGLICIAISVWCMIMNNTFGTYIALIMAFVVLLIISIFVKREILAGTILVILVFALTSAMTNYYTGGVSNNFKVTTGDAKSVASISGISDNAGSGRIGLWKMAVNQIKKTPVFGVGPDAYSDEPHNEILQLGVETGIPGAIFYLLGLMVIAFCILKKIKEMETFTIIDGIVVFGYIVSSMFGVIFFYTAVYYYIYLGMLSENNKKIIVQNR